MNPHFQKCEWNHLFFMTGMCHFYNLPHIFNKLTCSMVGLEVNLFSASRALA